MFSQYSEISPTEDEMNLTGGPSQEPRFSQYSEVSPVETSRYGHPTAFDPKEIMPSEGDFRGQAIPEPRVYRQSYADGYGGFSEEASPMEDTYQLPTYKATSRQQQYDDSDDETLAASGRQHAFRNNRDDGDDSSPNTGLFQNQFGSRNPFERASQSTQSVPGTLPSRNSFVLPPSPGSRSSTPTRNPFAAAGSSSPKSRPPPPPPPHGGGSPAYGHNLASRNPFGASHGMNREAERHEDEYPRAGSGVGGYGGFDEPEPDSAMRAPSLSQRSTRPPPPPLGRSGFGFSREVESQGLKDENKYPRARSSGHGGFDGSDDVCGTRSFSQQSARLPPPLPFARNTSGFGRDLENRKSVASDYHETEDKEYECEHEER